MRKTFLKIKSLFSFFKLDYSFWVMLLLFVLLEDIYLYFMYFLFLVLHELSHLLVAKRLGYLPKRLRLSAFGAALEGYDDFLTSDEIKIVLAGPIFNFIIVICCYLCFWFYPESYCFLCDVLTVNLSILMFNILPIFPLDAGRIILCLLSKKKRRFEAVKITKNISLFFVVLMFVFSIFSFLLSFGFSLGFVSINLCLLLFSSCGDTSFKREILLQKKIKRLNKGVKQKVVYVKEDFDEKLLLKFIDGEHYFVFVFVDEKFERKREIDEYFLLKSLGFI